MSTFLQGVHFFENGLFFNKNDIEVQLKLCYITE